MREIRVVPAGDPDFGGSWDALPDGGIRMSASWLQSAQRRVGGRSCAVLITGRAGLFMIEIQPGAYPFHDPVELLFGEPARNLVRDYIGARTGDRAHTAEDLISITAHRQPELYPAAAVVVPYGFEFSLRAGPVAGQEFDNLVDGCMAVAASWGARTLAFLFLAPGEDLLFGALLCRRGFIAARMDATFSTAVRWPDFDGYLADLTSRRRRRVRREIDGFAAHGLVLSSMMLADADDKLISRLAALSAMSQSRHGHLFDHAAELRVLHTVRSGYGSHARLAIASRGGTVLAFHMFYDWNGEYWAGMAGQDYDAAPPGGFAHFNVGYYEPIRLAIASGTRALHWGIGAGQTKVMRGADLVPLRSYFHVLDAVRPATAAMAEALNAAGERIADQLGQANPWRAASASAPRAEIPRPAWLPCRAAMQLSQRRLHTNRCAVSTGAVRAAFWPRPARGYG
jgi:predicted N-acyltransferase